MGMAAKIWNKVQELKGRANEAVGKATGNESLEAEGKIDQVKGNAKQVDEKGEDAFRD
ncbi:MAG TPA: CsbD family protein [Pseudonocardiaceae bacterium]|nr:CsbD family protein [Pseudonocardiaceae bacterium]